MIPLPKLPESTLALPYPDDDETVYTAFQVRQIQREAMRVALDAAAKFFVDNDSVLFWGGQAATHVRSLEIAND